MHLDRALLGPGPPTVVRRPGDTPRPASTAHPPEDVSSQQHVHPRSPGPGRQRALATVAERDGLDARRRTGAVHLERPARREHGDWSTNVALVNAKRAGTNPRALAESLVEVLRGRPTAPHVVGRGGRARVRQLPSRRRLAPRRAGRGRRPGRGGLRPPRRRPRRAGPGRVHLGQPDRAPPRRQRMVGELRRRPGPGAGPLRLPGQPRVLRQRHRRPDPDPRARASWPARRAGRFPKAATRAST